MSVILLALAPAPPPHPDPVTPEGSPDETPSLAPPPTSVEEFVGDDSGHLNGGVVSPPSESTEKAEAEAPVALPEQAVAAPHQDEPHAFGGEREVPLPSAPESEDPSSLSSDPWRGRFWLGVGIHASIPVGGRAPAAGSVVAPVPEASFGWRIRPFVGLHTSLSRFVHDVGFDLIPDAQGDLVERQVFGRITAFDLLTARFYVPRPKRVEPWAEVGGGIGIRRGPIEPRAEAAGLIRVGTGVDLWLSPIFSLAPSFAYRVIAFDNSVGHGLRAGADISLHW